MTSKSFMVCARCGRWGERLRSGLLLGGALALLTMVAPQPASASSGLDSPEAGVISLGRGGAWLVYADDPLAAYYNPAALVTQPHSVHLGGHVMFASQCFERLDQTGQPLSPGGSLGSYSDEVCANIAPLPNPQLAASFRLHDRVALGLAVLGPHQLPVAEWPETVTYETGFGAFDGPSPTRYLLLRSEAVVVWPTLSLSVAATDELSFGAGFVWGVAALEFSNMAEALSPPRAEPDDFTQDVRAQVSGVDGFVPGLVASVRWAPIRRFEVVGWYRLSDSIRTSTDFYGEASYYTNAGAADPPDPNDPNDARDITDRSDAGEFELAVPMEAKLGFRYRHPRSGAKLQQWARRWSNGGIRDTIAEDVFDLEVNLTWANNSAVDKVNITFDERIRLEGTPGILPTDASVPHQWKDVLGVRLGGQYNVIPDLLALRLGGFFESKGVDDEYLNLDFHMAEKIGVGAGATLRLSRFDVSLAYLHTYYGSLDNAGQGVVKAVSGDATTGDYRTRQAVNGGRATRSLDEIALGATVHF